MLQDAVSTVQRLQEGEFFFRHNDGCAMRVRFVVEWVG